MLTPDVFAKYADMEHVVKAIPPSQQKELMENCRLALAIPRWRRFIMRLVGRFMWRAESLQLWLLQRSHLRFLPWPYPSISSVEDWKYQSKTMADQLVLVPRHHELALHREAFTSQNLLELSRFRDRVGWKFAFMEDEVLSGLMALKSGRGVSAKLKAAALEEARIAVAENAKQGRKLEATRELIGPRGGLPSLKSDLIKLALLCEVPVLDSDTVPMLQKKIRPVVEALRGTSMIASKDVCNAYVQSPIPGSSASASKAKAKAVPSATPTLMKSAPLDSAAPTMQQLAELMDTRLHGTILEQDQRMQTMMTQVMQHIETRFQSQQVAPEQLQMMIPNGMPDSQMEEFPPQMPS